MNKFWGHLKTITHHRHLVMRGCFRMGLIWQGLTHDLSKYSPTEFFAGVRYFQGSRSPNTAEREANGYSLAWMHHKGRNRHHFEYWTDLSPVTRTYEPVDMPVRYLCEMVADRIAACKTYQGAAYTDASALQYLDRAQESRLVHPNTMKRLRFLLTMLAEQGEPATFRFMRQTVLKANRLRNKKRALRLPSQGSWLGTAETERSSQICDCRMPPAALSFLSQEKR